MAEKKPVVLLVEDEQAIADACMKTVRQKVPDVDVVHEKDFSKASARIEEVLPDVVVLDLLEGDVASDDPAGLKVWEHIWRGKFCPLIFHSARARSGDDSIPEDHPFIKYVFKKARSDQAVADHLKGFLPHVTALKGVEREIVYVVQDVLREVAPVLWNASGNEQNRDRMLIRATRRRVAAKMDDAAVSDSKPMANWEQYLFPPIGKDVLMGDIIRSLGADSADPSAYRLVLSPSCDMVKGRNRCLSQLLVAKCGPIEPFLKSANVHEAKDGDLQRKLPSILTRDECGGYVAFPPLPQIIPLMAACLRDLELVPYEAIGKPGDEGVKFARVASVDSPFRERLAWTYLQIAARPGMPEADHDEFAAAIRKDVQDRRTPK